MIESYGGMTFAKFFPSDWRTGCLVLDLEEEGLYIRLCMFHYDTGKALPDDYPRAARMLNVHINKFRKVMDSLISKGKVIRAQGILFNERVQEEIDKYRMEHVARSRAAVAREADRKAIQLAKAVEAEIERRRQATPPVTPLVTPPMTPPVAMGVTPHVTSGSPMGSSTKNTNDFNDHYSTPVTQENQSRTTNLEARNQKPETNNKLASKSEPKELAGLNGKAEPMIMDVVAWMRGGDEQSARQWLGTVVMQYGQNTIRDSYVKLKTDIASGKLVASPLQTWSTIARRIHGESIAVGQSASPAARAEAKRRLDAI